MLLILSHGQAQVERGFSINEHLLDDNILGYTLVGQRIVHDQMISGDMKSYEIQMTTSLMGHVKEAKKRYFSSRKEWCKKTIRSEKDAQRVQIHLEIENINTQMKILVYYS